MGTAPALRQDNRRARPSDVKEVSSAKANMSSRTSGRGRCQGAVLRVGWSARMLVMTSPRTGGRCCARRRCDCSPSLTVVCHASADDDDQVGRRQERRPVLRREKRSFPQDDIDDFTCRLDERGCVQCELARVGEQLPESEARHPRDLRGTRIGHKLRGRQVGIGTLVGIRRQLAVRHNAAAHSARCRHQHPVSGLGEHGGEVDDHERTGGFVCRRRHQDREPRTMWGRDRARADRYRKAPRHGDPRGPRQRQLGVDAPTRISWDDRSAANSRRSSW